MGLLKAAVKDLMGYKRMLMKKFDERNVTVSEDAGELSFLRGFWPAGTSLRAASRVLPLTGGDTSIPETHCLEQHSLRNESFFRTWQIESEAVPAG